MSTALVQMPAEETALRHERCRKLLNARLPGAGGLLLFSPINLYYLTGTLATGALWLPLAGEPVLLVRKGLERARAESPLKHILPYRSYSELKDACAGAGSPLSTVIAVEKGGMSWAASEMLQAKLQARFEDASPVLSRARAVKTPYERVRMREAGARQRASYEALTSVLRAGMTEREIGMAVWSEFMARDHTMLLRTANPEGEVSLGQVSAGDNATASTCWDGTVGGPGCHATAPYLGSMGTVWVKHSLLMVDLCFNYQGYHTDVSQTFWSGTKADLPDAARRAHDVCVAIHERAAALLKPGNTPEHVWQEAQAMAVQAGFADSFMGFGENQVKFLGHGIGLAYDEFPALARRFDEPFEVGMFLAVEPKIALPGLGLVGLENVFEITENGARSITGEGRDIVYVNA